ncbi:MAG TPA: type II toxin-antitoxin system death-on-curing family toxin [Lacipirellulaceae bacterium]|nr:type II toxin-antitoxin system death-on-curing family toxin [Lacipirellulaceae bacterium]
MIRGYLPGKPRFLSTDEALTLHETGIDAYGGSYEIRDVGLLDSALALPRQGIGGEYVHEFPFEMAAAYLFHICADHPFVDGNKRAALATCIVFLRMNGWNLISPEDAAYQIVLDVARSLKSKTEVAVWLRNNVRPRNGCELRDFFQGLNYETLAKVFGSIAAGQSPEQVATIVEAGHAIPAIPQANIGAVALEQKGDIEAAYGLRQQAMLLTAIYRIAEDMGYEW